MIISQAVILAGGFGKRLGVKSLNTPKPLQKINGKPFLDYIIWNLKRYGIKKILITTGYLSNQIFERYKNGLDFGVKIEYINENEPAGTAGSLLLCKDYLEDFFFLLNGDTIFDINFDELSLFLKKTGTTCAIGLQKVSNCSNFGSIALDDNTVISFNEKSNNGKGLINGGVTAFNKNILNFIKKIPSSLEDDIYPRLVKEKEISAMEFNSFFIDIGLPDTLEAAQVLIPKWRKKKVVFLDRDGVINIDYGYVATKERFTFIKGSINAIKKLNDMGILVIVITNQSGIARGLFSEKQFLDFMQWVNNQLRKKAAHIDAFYYCPHHPNEGNSKYTFDCDCRKPKSGLIKKALAEWQLDPSYCCMYGDKESDLQAAKNLGISNFLFNHLEDDLLSLISRTFLNS